MAVPGKSVKIAVIGLICTLLVLGVPVCAGTMKISKDNGAIHNTPEIDGTSVVWEDYNAGPPTDGIYLYDVCGDTPTKISGPAAVEPHDPQISGDTVVWADKRNSRQGLVWYSSSSGETPLLFDFTWIQGWPAISGNTVVFWTGPGGHEIWAYLNRETYKSLSPCLHQEYKDRPRISGNYVVWADSRNDPDGLRFDIFLYDLSLGTERQISSSANNHKNPDISGNRVVWEEENPGSPDPNFPNADIVLYDISSGTSGTPTWITNDPSVNQRNPAISANRIVWEEYSPSTGWDIYRYTIDTGKKDLINNDAGDQLEPDISGDYIVWQDIQKQGIYLYQETGPYPFSNLLTCLVHKLPHFVPPWPQFRNLGPSSFTGTSEPTQPPVMPQQTPPVPGPTGLTVDFTADTTYGTAPLRVTFTDLSTGQNLIDRGWVFGDGGYYAWHDSCYTGSGPVSPCANPAYPAQQVHTYYDPGTYTVKLTVADAEGGADVMTKKDYIVVTPQSAGNVANPPAKAGPVVTIPRGVKLQPPVFTFKPDPSSGYVPFTVTCRANLISSVGPIVSYKWDFGDGTPPGYGQTVTHTYTVPGTYRIFITATDSYGTSASTKAEVGAYSPTTVPTTPPAPVPVTQTPEKSVVKVSQ